MIDPH